MKSAIILTACLCILGAQAAAADPGPQYHFEDILISAASATEPLAAEFSVEKALRYLEDGTRAWIGERGCITCHTTGTYATIRPLLSPRAGPPPAAFREFLGTFFKRVSSRSMKTLREQPSQPETVIFTAAGLAEWDQHITKTISPDTDAALRLMLTLQRADGTWDAMNCWPPFESDSYHPATVAVMALAAAPGWLEQLKDESMLAAVERLKNYLRTATPPHDYARVWLLWAAARVPGLLDDTQRAELIKMISAHQRDDSGWSIRTFAKPEEWGQKSIRAKKLRQEPEFAHPPSDGHMTGLALIVLRESGVPKNDPRLTRGITWLKTNQRTSGRWWTRSLNTDEHHFITYSGTAYPLLALHLCDAWP